MRCGLFREEVWFVQRGGVVFVQRGGVVLCREESSGGVRVRGLYDFIAEESDELGFRAGDVIEVLDQSDSAWWRGRLRGQTGLFPL
ncbi:UNVERIFIED_CONTAM: hypothetical protein FKN15_009006 [Acipenser sinensis]